MARGGARTGAGAKKGSKWPATIAKEAANEIIREMVIAEIRPIVEAQIKAAKGISFLGVRDKNGKFTRVVESVAKASLAKGEELFELWEVPPSVQIGKDLLDRTAGKPVEPVAVEHGVSQETWDALDAGRKRNAERRKALSSLRLTE